ncbi:phosphoadenosine phosphosulfate reductase family protein [Leptolyngbya sp. AN03gr2]|uniref:phosphoadenosine phosphosulfate reductase domain-containing protein n=1 Tax=unclassified Leptolyngbya TaxID=2650499 RepID=UPI003D323107
MQIKQLELEPSIVPASPLIGIPPLVKTLLDQGAALALNLSGGVDSQALVYELATLYRQNKWNGPILAIHCDMGQTEWPQTKAICEQIAKKSGIELIIVEADLLNAWQQRMDKLMLEGNTKPFWSDAKNRYCTSLKVGALHQYLRKFKCLVSAIGLRAEESDNRAGKAQTSLCKISTSRILQVVGYKTIRVKNKERLRTVKEPYRNVLAEEAYDRWVQQGMIGRFAIDWLPLHAVKKNTIWQICGHSFEELQERRALHNAGFRTEALTGWNCHPAYVWGADRLSCALCVLGNWATLKTGAIHNTELFQTLREMEIRSGKTFQNGRSLKQFEGFIPPIQL